MDITEYWAWALIFFGMYFLIGWLYEDKDHMSRTRTYWKKQQIGIDMLTSELTRRGIEFFPHFNCACPHVELADKSWKFFVTNSGHLIACPRQGQLSQFKDPEMAKILDEVIR